MKKSFSYNLTQFGATDNTVTEQIKTSDGVKTITTDANTGAVILTDSVDGDSLNPVTGAAVATAIAECGGLPEYGESDANKVLKVNAGATAVEWADDENTSYTFSTGLTEESGTVTVTNPVPSASSGDNGKVLGVTDSSGTLGWVAQGGSVVVDSNSPFNGSGTAASPLGLNIDSDSLNVSANSVGPIAYADAKFTGDSAIGTLLDTSTTVTMTFTGVGGYAQPGDYVNITLTYGSNDSYYLNSRTGATIANDRSVTLTINVHNVSGNGTWSTDSTLYKIKLWDGAGFYASYTNVTIVDPVKRLRINQPVPAFDTSTDVGKVLTVTANGLEWVLPT